MSGRFAPNRLLVCCLTAAIAGLIGAVSQGIWSAWWLQILSLSVLWWLIFARRQFATKPAAAFVIAFVYGLAYFCLGVGWLYISMHRYGGMVAPLAVAGVFALSSLLASFSALAAYLTVRLVGREGQFLLGKAPMVSVLIFSSFWALAEWTRGWILNGFPWIALGYSQLDGPLIDAAPIIGVYGLSLLTCLVAAGVTLLIVQARQGSWSSLGAGSIVLAWLFSFSFSHLDFVTPTGKGLSVRLIQGNIAQEMKFDPVRAEAAMRMYIAQIRGSKAALTVIPETAWISFWDRTPEPLADALKEALSHSKTIAAIGLPAIRNGQIYNSLEAFDANAKSMMSYNKRHLVPFGEYVPPGFRWFVEQMRIPLGDFGRGEPDQTLLNVGTQAIGFNICYEDLFGEELAAQVRQGAHILVNISNIAWFGDSHALAQHLAIARMRAVELGRPMLRATNTGVTAAINAQGAVLAQLPNYEQASLDVEVFGTSGFTPYARFGNSLFLGLAFTLSLIGLTILRNAYKPHKSGVARKDYDPHQVP